MNLKEKTVQKWKSMNKTVKASICVLIALVLGVIIYSIGIGIGEAVYHAIH